jgi:hypothetical protein
MSVLVMYDSRTSVQVLDRMNSVLRRQSLTEVQATEGQALRQGARRIVLKLAKDADVLPESLFIKGLHIPRIDRAVCLGGFADIYLGSYQNQAVAVKRLRVSDEHKSVNSVSCRFQPSSWLRAQ